MAHCGFCKFVRNKVTEYPCNDCVHGHGVVEHFEMAGSEKAHQQPTKPSMSPVNPPKDEEINHPSRYAGGKFECIDIMLDVFGKEAVKHFCLLNAFKYIWRQEKKGGVEDVKKAVCYLNKYIELSDSHENV